MPLVQQQHLQNHESNVCRSSHNNICIRLRSNIRNHKNVSFSVVEATKGTISPALAELIKRTKYGRQLFPFLSTNKGQFTTTMVGFRLNLQGRQRALNKLSDDSTPLQRQREFGIFLGCNYRFALLAISSSCNDVLFLYKLQYSTTIIHAAPVKSAKFLKKSL